MTTLPQTTSIRLPRPVGTLQLPGAGGLAVPHAAPALGGMSGGDVWRVIRAHFWLILILAMLAGVAGYGIFMVLNKKFPRFTAVGLIEVRNPTPIGGGGERNSENIELNAATMMTKTTAQKLMNEALISRVLGTSSSDTNSTRWRSSFPSAVEAKQDFLAHFTADPIPETQLVRVSLTMADPADAQKILQEVVDRHLEDQRKYRSDLVSDQTKSIRDLRTRYEMHRQQVNQAMREKAIVLNTEGGGLGRVGIKDIELSEAVRRLSESSTRLLRAESVRNGFEEQLSQGRDLPGVTEMANHDWRVMNFKSQLDAYDLSMMQMEKYYGTNSRQYRDQLDAKKLIQRKYDDAFAEAKSTANNSLRTSAASEAEALATDAKAANGRVEQLRADLGELTNKVSDYMVQQEEERGLRTEINNLDKQLTLAETNSNRAQTLSRVEWAQTPVIPDTPTFPIRWKVMALSISVGLMLGLAFAFLRELSDTTVRSDRDITRIGQLQLLGMVPDENDDPHAAGARLPLVIFDAPHSMTAEKLREIRTRLQHVASLDTTRSIMVSSPGPQDGKTVIATNLAAGLALNGRRILLVDANFRRPQIHQVFGVTNEQGFSDVLSGGLAFEDVVQESQVPNLSIMVAGPKPINATEMFESQLLIDFIERALEEYDHVVFDSGPLMVVAEAMAMAPRVDGVVTVVRAKTNSRGLLSRMRDALRQVKAEHLGIVLNGVRAQGGGYYGRNIKTYYEYQNAALPGR